MNIFSRINVIRNQRLPFRCYRFYTSNIIPLNQYNSGNSLFIKNYFNDNSRLIINKRDFRITNSIWDTTILKTPTFAESVSEGDVRWSKGVGDSVSVDELIGEVETDKTAIPIHSPVNGVIEELLVNDGDTVVANQDIVKIKEGKSDGAKAAPTKEAAEPTKEALKVETPKAEAPAATNPLHTDKLIKEIKPPVDITELRLRPTAAAAPGKAGVEFISGSRGEQRIKMNRMRLRIAERLKDAQNTCAMLTTFNECDMSQVIALRKKYQEQFMKKHGVKLGFMSAFVKAAAVALADQPVVNAVIDDGHILYRDYVDISVAVATPRGLLVPVLRDVHAMDFSDIELGIAELGKKARDGNLAIEDMEGGTFTISNGGVFGSLLGTPIINPPQSAILGIHATQMRPVASPAGEVVVRPMMYMALTYDHRLVDGKEAVTFLRKIKAFIEEPASVLLKL